VKRVLSEQRKTKNCKEQKKKTYGADFVGAFYLVRGGYEGAVLTAAFPDFGIDFPGVVLAFGLTSIAAARGRGNQGWDITAKGGRSKEFKGVTDYEEAQYLFMFNPCFSVYDVDRKCR